MEEARPIQVAQIYDQEQNPMNGRVYSQDGICPTIRTPMGGLSEPKIMESAILTPKRTETAKELRRQRIEVFANRELVPREDGCSNTITTVQKDNLLQETCILGYTRDSKGNIQNAHGYNKGGLFEDISPTVTSSAFQYNNFVITKYRIRKLTEREVFRLMGMDDADIDKIDAYRIQRTLKNGKVKEKPISKSAKYRMAGNSIVVNVLTHVFYQMFIAEPPKPQPKQLTLFD